MSNDNLQRINIRISREVHEYFKRRSELTGVPMSSLMYLALEAHMEQQIAVKGISEFAPYLEQLKAIKQIQG